MYLMLEEHSPNQKKNAAEEQNNNGYRYVQIKRREMKRMNKTMKILQIVDISHTILYD